MNADKFYRACVRNYANALYHMLESAPTERYPALMRTMGQIEGLAADHWSSVGAWELDVWDEMGRIDVRYRAEQYATLIEPRVRRSRGP